MISSGQGAILCKETYARKIYIESKKKKNVFCCAMFASSPFVRMGQRVAGCEHGIHARREKTKDFGRESHPHIFIPINTISGTHTGFARFARAS